MFSEQVFDVASFKCFDDGRARFAKLCGREATPASTMCSWMMAPLVHIGGSRRILTMNTCVSGASACTP